MHAVAIKTELLEEHPWLAEAVFNAYVDAKNYCLHTNEQTRLGL